ncbi:MAG: hypothetical protein PWQ82_1534 [Thermosediminibacterales bacterium]|nr:hypothetical protein [Thermosediminibacterales bacterium]
MMEQKEFMDLVIEKLSLLEKGQKALEERQKALEEHQKSLEAGQKEHTQLLRALEERTAITNATVIRLEEDLNYIKGEISKLTKRINEQDLDLRLIKKVVVE